MMAMVLGNWQNGEKLVCVLQRQGPATTLNPHHKDDNNVTFVSLSFLG